MTESKPTNQTDEELMQAYKMGNTDAFNILYNRYSEKIYSYIRSKINKQELADELYQQVFYKIHHKRSNYDPKYPFISWIFTISRNTLTDYYRKNSTENLKIESFKSEQKTQTPQNEEVLTFNSSLIDHYKNIGLNEKQIHILKLKFESDLDNQEIADLTNQTTVNIRKILSRSIKKIRENILKSKEFSNE